MSVTDCNKCDQQPKPPTASCLDKLKMKVSTLDKICCFLAELIGTALLIFLGCMGCINNSSFTNSHLQATLTFGLIVMVIIQSFGCVSGAHLNPAVTLAAFIYDMISLHMVVIYIVAQMLGAFIGYGLLKALVPATAINVPGNEHGLCVTVVHPDITTMQGLGIEIVITSVLILICCGVWDPRNSKFLDSAPLRFGLAISGIALTAGQFTGASMNPARSFAPALWNNDFTDHWLYWVGPMSSAAITAVVYKAIFRRELVDEKANNKLRAMEEVPLS